MLDISVSACDALDSPVAVLCVFAFLGCHQGAVTSAASPLPDRLVAEAPISGEDGNAFLPLTIHGRVVTVVIDLQNPGDLSLAPDALAKAGVTLADTTQLDSMTMGSAVEHHVPLRIMQNADLDGADEGGVATSPVVGVLGSHFLTRYDLLYDIPMHRIRLYAFHPHTGRSAVAWLPPGVQPMDCGRMLPVPMHIQYPPFTGVALQLNGRSVMGVIEMGPYIPKMNQMAANVLELTPHSPNIRPNTSGDRQDLYGNPVYYKAIDIHLTVGRHTFWTGPVEILQKLGVDDSLPPQTPVMLMNLITLGHTMLFNAVSSGQVCISTPARHDHNLALLSH